MPDSILSTEERKVAAALRDGTDVETIAAERDQSVETVERAVDRIREKTERALATLAESPFTGEAAATLDDGERDRLAAELASDGDT